MEGQKETQERTEGVTGVEMEERRDAEEGGGGGGEGKAHV